MSSPDPVDPLSLFVPVVVTVGRRDAGVFDGSDRAATSNPMTINRRTNETETAATGLRGFQIRLTPVRATGALPSMGMSGRLRRIGHFCVGRIWMMGLSTGVLGSERTEPDGGRGTPPL